PARMDVPASTTLSPLPQASPSVRPAPLSDRVLALADRHRYKLFAGLFLLYLAGFNGHWRPEPDSALYLTIGRNLATGLGFTYQDIPHHLAFPGLPRLFALIFKVFHTEKPLPALVIMLPLGSASLAPTY